MTRSSLRELVTISATYCYPVMSPLHIAKQQLLYSTLLMSHRYYSNEKQDGEYLSTVALCIYCINCICDCL